MPRYTGAQGGPVPSASLHTSTDVIPCADSDVSNEPATVNTVDNGSGAVSPVQGGG